MLNQLQLPERFIAQKLLGRGGMGAVFEVYDSERETTLALKTLLQVDSEGLYRFKREFRAVADIRHPNIVRLFELFLGDQNYFTMELIRGRSLGQFLELRRASQLAAPSTLSQTRPVHGDVAEPSSPTTLPGARPPLAKPEPEPESPRYVPGSAERVRAALPPLVRGLETLHGAGIVHRDVKPSNAMVTADSRIVLMDFGVVSESTRGISEVVGTPSYMAPEQFDGEAVAATDWYAVGVILYEALHGARPFAGSPSELVDKKRAPDALARVPWAPEVPHDLRTLGTALLSPRPSERPDAGHILAVLAARPKVFANAGTCSREDPAPLSEGHEPAGDAEPFVGRSLELSALDDALGASRQGSFLVVIEGASGIGKSALVQRFTRALRKRDPRALVLSGRCHERETLAYKGFDAIIDELTQLLLGWYEEERASVLGDDGALCARLFPVFGALVKEPRSDAPPAADAAAFRLKAMRAVAEMLGRLAMNAPVVLWVDDLQWADADSLELLRQLVRSNANRPAPLLIVSRREDASRTELQWQQLLESIPPERKRTISLAPLTETEGRELVAQLSADVREPERFDDAHGNPLFIQEIVRARKRDPSGPAQSFEQALLRRIRSLPGAARTLLDAATIAGEPTTLRALAEAAQLDANERESALAVLMDERLLRPGMSTGQRVVETYHDRIREVWRTQLDAQAHRELNHRLAESLERAGGAEASRLARHFSGAGRLDEAARCHLRAAESARSALAFGRAAEHLAEVLALVAHSPSEEVALRIRRAEALASANRSSDAADEYERAARLATRSQVDLLRERVAEQRLRAGEIKSAFSAIVASLRGVGVTLPVKTGALVPALLYQRARMRLRGVSFVARAPEACDPAALRRLDLILFGGMTLGYVVSAVHASYLSELGCRLALDEGDPDRICRALSSWLQSRLGAGESNDPLVLAAQRELERVVPLCKSDYSRAHAHMTLGMRFVFEGHTFQAGLEPLRQASELFANCIGAAWETITAERYHWNVAMYSNRLDLLAQRVKWLEQRIDVHRDYYGRTVMAHEPVVWTLLREDAADAALRLVESRFAVVNDVESVGFTMTKYHEATGRIWCHHYRQETTEALRWASQAFRAVWRSPLRFVPAVVGHLTASFGLLSIANGDVAGVRRARRILARNTAPGAASTGHYLDAALAAHRGDTPRAIAALQAAEGVIRETGCGIGPGLATSALRGDLIGGEEGKALRASAEASMRAVGVVNPRRFLDMLAPWWPGALNRPG